MDRILYTTGHEDLPFLEDVLIQLVHELHEKNDKERCRETSLIITKIEEALHWQYHRNRRKEAEANS